MQVSRLTLHSAVCFGARYTLLSAGYIIASIVKMYIFTACLGLTPQSPDVPRWLARDNFKEMEDQNNEKQ